MPTEETSQRNALDALADLAHQFGLIVESGTKALDLTPVRARVLFDLQDMEPCSQRQISASQGMTAQQTAVLIDALEHRGLVQRDRDSADRRAVSVRLTSEGRSRVTQIATMRTQMAQRLLGHLNEEQLRALTATLQDLSSRAEGD